MADKRPLGAVILAVGFTLSLITNILAMVPFLLAFAAYTYVVGVLIRGVGWIVLGANIKRTLAVIGVSVLVFSPIFMAGLMLHEDVAKLLGIGRGTAIGLALTSWAAYSILEASGYISLRRRSKAFYVSMVSIITIIYIIYLALGLVGEAPPSIDDLLHLTPIVLIPLSVSAASNIVGTLKIKIGVEAPGSEPLPQEITPSPS